ncbi:hypothetical protein CMI37_31280 [Candidatus Pacearchaeota archaeon]|nr:hypothetical protein [Candidatus Pacearchaeota archaeon]
MDDYMTDEMTSSELIRRHLQDADIVDENRYGGLEAEEKLNHFKFFKDVVEQTNVKTANLTEDELGQVKIPVRTHLEISEYCKAMNMNAFSNYFQAKSQVVQATSLSRGGFLPQLVVTTKREAATTLTKTGQPQVNKGWFKPKEPAPY